MSKICGVGWMPWTSQPLAASVIGNENEELFFVFPQDAIVYIYIYIQSKPSCTVLCRVSGASTQSLLKLCSLETRRLSMTVSKFATVSVRSWQLDWRKNKEFILLHEDEKYEYITAPMWLTYKDHTQPYFEVVPKASKAATSANFPIKKVIVPIPDSIWPFFAEAQLTK